MNSDLTQIYKKYSGLWVALDSNLKRVLASNRSAKKAYTEAVKKGYKIPTLFKVPKRNLPYVG